MNPYTYRISLRLKHPSANLAEIYQVLSQMPEVIPGRLCNIGEERTTPHGEKLDGHYTESWCGFGFTDEKQSSDDQTLSDAINTIMAKLSPHKDLFAGNSKTGGTADFFIGLFVDANCGVVLDVELLKKLADLQIEVGFDIYPPDTTSADEVKA